MTMDDAKAIEEHAEHILAVQPEMQRQLQIQYNNRNANTSIIGTSANYLEVRKYELDAGKMFTPAHDAARARVAVIGPAVAQLLGFDNPIALVGEQVRIRGIQFDVIGVLKSKGQGGGFGNPDEQVLIPLNTARFRVMGTDRLRSINVLATQRRRHSARHGGDSEGAAPRAPAAAGEGRRLQHPQPVGLPEHARRDDGGVRAAARRDRDGESRGRRHRHHEHHAGVGHGAHARDRRAQSARRDAEQHPVAVPDRGDRAVHHGRHRRDHARIRRPRTC